MTLMFPQCYGSGRPSTVPTYAGCVVERKDVASWLDGLGAYCTMSSPDALGWYWTRTSCCLWYQTSSGSYCDDCSLHDPTELTTKRLADLAGSTPT